MIDGEDRIRDALRAWAYAADIYQGREGLQTVFVLLFVVTAVLALAMVWRLWRRKRHSPDQALPCLANCALLGFAPLYALRIVSLHVTDMLLYTGPIRLNWVIDLSLTGISLACALLFLRLGGARR
ncbi:hypothetical protein [Aurantiacibacter gangjinensis]|uniref:Uncharacterized protein n=1 Tax=Aurantiacibacter gangjinensis TaxID=502682 RepID=A0A0G9MQ55_9SPHN|nr:hypothetical protein [Aurantiacibacter gangjinensis]APE27343.1 hypothetical protein BMF35_a0514 [Aurantiacibacter gangjinensis]KLE31438.1 hypothetical protein AAW01_07550 [Aurantiacibacter gangjinensis]